VWSIVLDMVRYRQMTSNGRRRRRERLRTQGIPKMVCGSGGTVGIVTSLFISRHGHSKSIIEFVQSYCYTCIVPMPRRVSTYKTTAPYCTMLTVLPQNAIIIDCRHAHDWKAPHPRHLPLITHHRNVISSATEKSQRGGLGIEAKNHQSNQCSMASSQTSKK
jgi:hypothetical protein